MAQMINNFCYTQPPFTTSSVRVLELADTLCP